MENLQIDENGRNVLGAITNDAFEYIKNLRVNPATGRLLVDAHLTSTNTEIGDTIPGGTAGSVLFLGLGATLAQDNANFFWDDTNNYLGIGTDTPAANVDIEGTFIYNDGTPAANLLMISTDILGSATWTDISTNATIMQNIANSNLFVTALVNNNTFTTALAGDSNFLTEITNNFNLTPGTIAVVADGVTIIGDGTTANPLIAIAGTGILDSINADSTPAQTLSNADTFIDITDNGTGDHSFDINVANLTSDSTFLSDISSSLADTITVVTDGVTITGTGVIGDPLIAVSAGTGLALATTITQTHAFSVGQVIKMDSTGVYVLAQANSAINSEAVGIVTAISTTVSFTYVSSAIVLSYANAFTPGDGLFLSPTVAGGITNVKPTTVGQFIRAVGTCLSATEIYFDIAALAEEITSATPGANLGFSVQDISLYNANNALQAFAMTSNQDGSLLFTVHMENSSSINTITRWVKDSLTGNYYATHQDGITGDNSVPKGIAVVGNYVFVVYEDSGNLLERYDIADLANPQAFTWSGTDYCSNMWSDGTNLYIYNTNNKYTKFTLAGTVATNTSDITYTSSGATSTAICDGNFVWIESGSLTINKYAITGGAATATLVTLMSAYDDDAGITTYPLFMGSSVVLGIGKGFNWQGQSNVIGGGAHLMGVTLP